MSCEDAKQPQGKGDLGVLESEAYGSKESGGGGVDRVAPTHVSNQIYEQVAPSRDDTHQSKGDGFCRGLCAGLCCYCCLDICF